MNFSSLATLYKVELLENVIPFWEAHSIDKESGGFFTCLNRNGSVFDTDKFIWLQGRQTWMFAMLYNQVEQRETWLDIAKHGADFLIKHGRDEHGCFYFSTNREGQPLIAPYNIFSDCFAAQAFGQLYTSTGDNKYAELAMTTFNSIVARQNNPKGKWSKGIGQTRSLKNFALPMILCNLALELEHLMAKENVEQLIANCIHEVMHVFYDNTSGLILENVDGQGNFFDSFEGRLLNPGHAIEAMWFIIDIAVRNNDQALIEKAKDIVLTNIEYSWDKDFGGLFYFMDIKGHPPQQLEWDQKLWWVHIETLIALLKSYLHTKDIRCLHWFEKVHDYTWANFKDEEYGEWYGYLNRRGEVLLSLKGGKWKGCYHVPRGLYQCWKTMEKLQKIDPI